MARFATLDAMGQCCTKLRSSVALERTKFLVNFERNGHGIAVEIAI